MTNYKEQRQAFIELMDYMAQDDFNEDRTILKLTLKYEVSERSLRKRIELIKGVKQYD